MWTVLSQQFQISWIEYASKKIRDEASSKMEQDPQMKTLMENMPFDGQRMIYGGFESVMES